MCPHCGLVNIHPGEKALRMCSGCTKHYITDGKIERGIIPNVKGFLKNSKRYPGMISAIKRREDNADAILRFMGLEEDATATQGTLEAFEELGLYIGCYLIKDERNTYYGTPATLFEGCEG